MPTSSSPSLRSVFLYFFWSCSLRCAQTWILIEHAFTEFFVVSKMESDLGYASDLIGAGLNFAASTYYTWRAYKVGQSLSSEKAKRH